MSKFICVCGMWTHGEDGGEIEIHTAAGSAGANVVSAGVHFVKRVWVERGVFGKSVLFW